MFSDVLGLKTNAHTSKHAETETGMLKQDFIAINVSLNNFWMTGGIEIFGYGGCGQCLVLSVLE